MPSISKKPDNFVNNLNVLCNGVSMTNSYGNLINQILRINTIEKFNFSIEDVSLILNLKKF